MTTALPPPCAPHAHTWTRACATLAVAPPQPGQPTRAFLVRACTVCGLAEVWHGHTVPGGVLVGAVEHVSLHAQPGGWQETRFTYDKTKEG